MSAAVPGAVSASESAARADAPVPNGPALASWLAAGIGSFAMGFVVILNEAGIFVAPSLYAPAGGVSGRTTIAVAVWLVAWGVLHARWRQRAIDPARVHAVVFLLIALGAIGTLPPVWALL
jgi:hypothetical protein